MAHAQPRSQWLPWEWVALALVTVTGVALNLWWLDARRPGLPFDIDEAGYLQRSFRDADALRSGGLERLWTTVRLPDPEAPLLTAVSGVIQWITGVGPYRLLAVVQLFYILVVVMTYWATRTLASRRWSLLAAAMVATMPGILFTSRQFEFSLPATAMFISVIATQMHLEDFESLPLSLLWGALVGLTLVSRTYVLALVPGIVLIAVVRLLAVRPGRRSWVHLVAGLILALVLAGSWYIKTWHVVLHYLTGYGYGNASSQYGQSQSVFSWTWWTVRFNHAVDSEVLAPTLLALVVCALGYAVSAGPQSSCFRRNGNLRFAWIIRSPWSVPLLFLVISYLVLSTSNNAGSDFELPLVPPAVVVCLALASRASPRVRLPAAAVCLVAGSVSFIGASVPSPIDAKIVSVGTGSLQISIFDPARAVLHYFGCSPAQPSCTRGEEIAYLHSWLEPSRNMGTMARNIASTHGRLPVIFFATQDRYLNTNTVDLYYQLEYRKTLPTGLLLTTEAAKVTPLAQLENPKYGQPNLVVTGPAPTTDKLVSPLLGEAAALNLLQSDGFSAVALVPIPDGGAMTLWWKDRGPVVPGVKPT